MFVFGTRPEAIKLAPLILQFRELDPYFQTITCVTGQHREMLAQVLDFFGIVPDFDLQLMTHGQGNIDFISKATTSLFTLMVSTTPDLVFVQGDTNTAYAAGLAAKHCHVTLAHLEAGLRSYDRKSPFPEEINRLMLGNLADIHFCPTVANVAALHRESITDQVHLVGNTVVDALLLAKAKGPHWGLTQPDGTKWDIYPDGRVLPNK